MGRGIWEGSMEGSEEGLLRTGGQGGPPWAGHICAKTPEVSGFQKEGF